MTDGRQLILCVGIRILYRLAAAFPYFHGYGFQAVRLIVCVGKGISPCVCHGFHQVPGFVPCIFYHISACICNRSYMVIVCRKGSCYPCSLHRIARIYTGAFHYVPCPVIFQLIHYILGRSSLCYIMLIVILILKLIAAEILHSRHIVVFVIFKLRTLLLGVCDRNQIMFLIILICLSKLLPEQGKPVKERKVGIVAVCVRHLNTGIIFFCCIHIA